MLGGHDILTSLLVMAVRVQRTGRHMTSSAGMWDIDRGSFRFDDKLEA